MTRWLSMVLCVVLTVGASDALAKRGAPKPADPVVSKGVKYVVSAGNGREGRIEALNARTGEKLWDAVIYTVEIDPKLEEDVQWVFITELAARDDTLRVTNERNEAYNLDLKTRKVTKALSDPR